LARRSYKSDKRRKELNRLKKQAEKREKRFSKKQQNADAEPALELGEDVPDSPDEQGADPQEESEV
jgi:hypothetical protein